MSLSQLMACIRVLPQRRYVPDGRSDPGAVVSTYVYDGDNLKRIEEVDGSVTTIVWDGADYLGDVI